MRRMEARRRKASALRLRHSQSLASGRQPASQAKVRSTIQRLGSAMKPVVDLHLLRDCSSEVFQWFTGDLPFFVACRLGLEAMFEHLKWD